jgi:enoyl-CoA hydratase
VVASKNVKIADAHVRVGLVAGDGGITAWSQSVGMNRAKRYLLTGEHITAEMAYDMGLVTDLVDTPEEVMPRARDIAARIVKLPPDGVTGTKRAFSRLSQQYAGAVFELGLAYEIETLAGPRVREAIGTLRAAQRKR